MGWVDPTHGLWCSLALTIGIIRPELSYWAPALILPPGRADRTPARPFLLTAGRALTHHAPARPFSCRKLQDYPAPQHVVLTRMRRAGRQGGIPARLARTILDVESELPRIPVPRSWVNKGVKYLTPRLLSP